MKKKALAMLLCALLILSLAACGATSASTPMDAKAAGAPEYYAQDAVTEADNGFAGAAPAPMPEPQEAGGEATVSADPVADKIIYSGYAEIETLDFDASRKAVDALIARVGGFLQNSSVTGSNYNSGRDYRSASYTIRIPAGSFAQVTDGLAELGNVVYCNTSADNITTQYRDTQARLEAYQVEYDRLLELLAKAATVEEMLAIESRLSDVRYSIESLTTTIQGWDSLINYSTLELTITEVKDLTTAQGPGLTYWQEVGAALKNTLKGLGRFFSNLLMFLIAALPVIAILAVVAVAAVIVIKKLRAKRKAKNSPKDE